jgi:hypothetical protein
MKKAILTFIPLLLFSLVMLITVKDASTVPLSSPGPDVCVQTICVEINGDPGAGCVIYVSDGEEEMKLTAGRHGCVSFLLNAGKTYKTYSNCSDESIEFTACTDGPIVLHR